MKPRSRFGGKCSECLRDKYDPEVGLCTCSEKREEHEEHHDGCELLYTLEDADYDRGSLRYEGL